MWLSPPPFFALLPARPLDGGGQAFLGKQADYAVVGRRYPLELPRDYQIQPVVMLRNAGRNRIGLPVAITPESRSQIRSECRSQSTGIRTPLGETIEEPCVR